MARNRLSGVTLREQRKTISGPSQPISLSSQSYVEASADALLLRTPGTIIGGIHESRIVKLCPSQKFSLTRNHSHVELAVLMAECQSVISQKITRTLMRERKTI